MTVCSIDPRFAFNTQDEHTEAPLTKVFLHMNSEGLVQQLVFCIPLHVDKHAEKIKSNDHKKQITLAKIPEIWLLHLPAKVIFVSKNWEMGEGRTTAGWSGGGPLSEMPYVAKEPWLASLRGAVS